MTQDETATTEEEQTTEDDGAGEGQMDDGLVTVTVDQSVDATVQRIQRDVENSDMTILATVDHAQNAASVDRDLPPTRLVMVGNPEVGTPLMQASRSVAIDLPQKLLVWDDNGQTMVTYNDPQYLARRHGIEGENERLNAIGSALRDLATGSDRQEGTATGTPTPTATTTDGS